MRLLDWLLGRGRNPLETRETPRVTAPPYVRTPERAAEDATAGGPVDANDEALLRERARALGVQPDVLRRMLDERAALVDMVRLDPRAWGLDLAPASTTRALLTDHYRHLIRMTGPLGESFLMGYEPLMALVPDPPTLPDGTPLDVHLQRHARVDADAARDIAHHVRTTLQATLGAPLDADAVEHAVREAAWDHDFDAASVTPQVLRAMEELL